jgi:hypothetical protein
MLLIIHKRKSQARTGTVTDVHGLILGRVFPDTKVAAGTNGQRRRFWTAEACYPGHPNIRGAASLGTRYPSQLAAAAAVRSFALEYPRNLLNDKATQILDEPPSWSRRDSVDSLYNRALSWAVNRWRESKGVASGRRFPEMVA